MARSNAKKTDGTPLPAQLEALCRRFGINPDPDAGELASFRLVEATREQPATVIVVTAGGLKITATGPDADQFDEGTEQRLRQIFRCYRTDPKTKETVVLPLPEDLTLPAPLRTGVSGSAAHRYEGGYLRRDADATPAGDPAPSEGAPASA
jgi:hypothetical protein